MIATTTMPQHALLSPHGESSEFAVTSISDSKKSKKRVHFGESVTVRCHLHRDDYLIKEYHQTWYTPEEFADMKKDIQTIVRAFVKGGEHALPNGTSFRGLEYKTKQVAKLRKARKMTAWVLVLEEQDRQLDYCKTADEDLIRQAYLKVSEPCQQMAEWLGQQDELALVEEPRQSSDEQVKVFTREPRKRFPFFRKMCR